MAIKPYFYHVIYHKVDFMKYHQSGILLSYLQSALFELTAIRLSKARRKDTYNLKSCSYIQPTPITPCLTTKIHSNNTTLRLHRLCIKRCH